MSPTLSQVARYDRLNQLISKVEVLFLSQRGFGSDDRIPLLLLESEIRQKIEFWLGIAQCDKRFRFHVWAVAPSLELPDAPGQFSADALLNEQLLTSAPIRLRIAAMNRIDDVLAKLDTAASVRDQALDTAISKLEVLLGQQVPRSPEVVITSPLMGLGATDEQLQQGNDTWTVEEVSFTAEDVAAFENSAEVNRHFGLPFPGPARERVFSISLNEHGRSNVHDPGKASRPHYFGNYVVYRYLRELDPDVWIWDERYRFQTVNEVSRDPRICAAQAKFVELFGQDRILEVQQLALKWGLKPGGKTSSRPDLAVFLPSRNEWRFIEIKIPERHDRVEETGDQAKWLQLFASYLGSNCAVELRLVRAQSKANSTIPEPLLATVIPVGPVSQPTIQVDIYAKLQFIETAMRAEGVEEFSAHDVVRRMYLQFPAIDNELGIHKLPQYLPGMMRHYVQKFGTIEMVGSRVGGKARYRFV